MDGQFEAMWITEFLALMALWWVPTIVALVLIGRSIAVRGRMTGLDVLDIMMVLGWCPGLFPHRVPASP